MCSDAGIPDSAKLARASDLFDQYQRAAERWVTGGGVIARAVVPGTVHFDFPPAPVQLSLLIGDTLQNLRSALDHEVYRIAVDRRGPQWSGLSKAQFPIYDDRASFERSQRATIGGLGLKVRRLIRSVQPFAEPQDPLAPHLLLLHKLARVDRHRLLHLAAAQPTELGVTPSVTVPGWAEVDYTLRIFLVDSSFAGVDTYNALREAIAAVTGVIERMRVEEREE